MESIALETPSHNFLSVDVPSSPVNPQKGNLTGSPRLVHDSSADLYNYIQEWNGKHLMGLGIISEICNLKLQYLNESNSKKNVYPNGLQELCDKLEEVCQKLAVIASNIKTVVNHFEGLMKLNQMKNISIPVFTTWLVHQYVDLSKKIHNMYEKELKLRIYILESIGHATTVDNILFYQTLWARQPYIDNYDLEIEAMLKETALR